ncbi:MAG: hypothetical protein M1833_004275 [Piccolia ochrophora]|nr:MAG: hypothetical protein M1833_004275 [Piccolia ochrophora]
MPDDRTLKNWISGFKGRKWHGGNEVLRMIEECEFTRSSDIKNALIAQLLELGRNRTLIQRFLDYLWTEDEEVRRAIEHKLWG